MALGELAAVDGMSQQRLGELLGLEKSTVSRLAAGLESRGWMAREHDPENRRFYRLSLTPAGRDLAERVGTSLRDHHERLLGGLTPDERAGLAIGLAGLLRVMNELTEESQANVSSRAAPVRRPGEGSRPGVTRHTEGA